MQISLVSKRLIFALSIIYMATASALVQTRWTDKDDTNSDFAHVLAVVNSRTAQKFSAEDFKLLESTRLATSMFDTYVQQAGGVPLRGRNLRIWKNTENGQTLQVEAILEEKSTVSKWMQAHQKSGSRASQLVAGLTSLDTMRLVREVVKASDDKLIQNTDWKDYWERGNLYRFVKVKSRRGYHQIKIRLSSQRVVEKTYSPFLQADIPVQVYPIYEQAPGHEKLLAPIQSSLRNLVDKVPSTAMDPFASMRVRRYWESQFDPVLGMIPAYQELGYWSPVFLKNQARDIIAALPMVDNKYESGFHLAGRYVTINLHPDAAKKFNGINFELKTSAQYKPNWVESIVDEKPVYEMVPGASLLGKPAFSEADITSRRAIRLGDHNPVGYINEGYDEVQVYWAVDTFMTELTSMGFTDPELSSRPFHAFLYDPDIGMRDNAYYTDDTINFTTYSPTNPNFARDNSTIWHELGHGIMDRLMGDYLLLADTGGLSEGMADFLARIIVQRVSNGGSFEGSDEFRILNKIGFHLTNEVHDDGEAYGGTMNDLLDNAIAKFGREGIVKVADLTMEAMRLSRNHPQLTAQEWFNHMIYADERPSAVRSAGEMRAVLVSSLEGRNYRFDDKEPASLTVKNGNDEITDRTPGSRNNPILHQLKADEKVTKKISVRLKSSDTYKFVYPVTIKVQLEGGPLQGAINWAGQEGGVLEYKLNSEDDMQSFDLTASGACEKINREDGSCVDFAWIQIWNAGETKRPVAKKRFYLRIKTIQ